MEETKYRLSTRYKWSRYFFLIFALIWLFFFVRALIIGSPPSGEGFFAAIFAILISLGIFFGMRRIPSLEFDESNLYEIGKRQKRIIPLVNITTIKLTMTKIGYSNVWKLKYINDEGENKSLRFFPDYTNFELFKEYVKDKNPEVEIKNWSHSFDLDQ